MFPVMMLHLRNELLHFTFVLICAPRNTHASNIHSRIEDIMAGANTNFPNAAMPALCM